MYSICMNTLVFQKLNYFLSYEALEGKRRWSLSPCLDWTACQSLFQSVKAIYTYHDRKKHTYSVLCCWKEVQDMVKEANIKFDILH